MNLFLSWMDNPQENTLDTMYDNPEKGTYSFAGGNGNTYMSQIVEDDGLASRHLSEESVVGHNFKLTFNIGEGLGGDPDETFGNHIITGLLLGY